MVVFTARQVNTFFSYCSSPAPDSQDGGGTATSTQWTVFGSSEHLKFQCSLASLLDDEQQFYELFLLDSATTLLTPVPVRIINAVRDQSRPNGFVTNGELCSRGGLHSRRFFLADTVSGLTADSYVSKPHIPVVLRYASRIILGMEPCVCAARIHNIFYCI